MGFIAVPSAFAATSGCPNTATNPHDGYISPSDNNGYAKGTAEGAYAEIRTEYGAVCGDGTLGQNYRVTAWSMIANGDFVHGWVQAGFARWSGLGDCAHYFSEMSEAGEPADIRFGSSGCLTWGAYGDYGERDQVSTDLCPNTTNHECLVTRINGNIWQQSWFNPKVQWHYPFVTNYAGEAIFFGSDVPGSSSAPTIVRNVQYQGNDDNFYNYGCNGWLQKYNDLANRYYVNPDGTHTSWYNQLDSCPGFDIWTAPAG